MKRNRLKLFTFIIGAIALVSLGLTFLYNFDIQPSKFQRNQDERASKVRQMAKHAWNGYYKYAKDSDELRPLSGRGFNWTCSPMYITAVDSLDTLFIMNLTEEYQEAKELVLKNLDFSNMDCDINMFEVVIRVLGGLISAYELDRDNRYIKKATELADRLLLGFNTGSGIPFNHFNLKTGKPSSYSTSIAKAGTIQLEFQYLSDITGNPEYQERAMLALEKIAGIRKHTPGLYPKFIKNVTENLEYLIPFEYGISAGADSFYEYLLKLYIATGSLKFKELYTEAAYALTEFLYVYDGDYAYAPDGRDFHHLSCFAGGMFATGAKYCPIERSSDLELGSRITQTCMKMYTSSKNGLGGERAYVVDNKFVITDQAYNLRPEVIESVFYMWRYTHDERYRNFAFQMILNLESYCKNDIGYHAIGKDGQPADKMMSFFIAETLKYLYLIFIPDDFISLDQYLFNTEGHIFRRNTNKFF